jgi:uncharacterized membrane protein
MGQLLQPGWWLSYAGTALPWYLFCVVASVLALPLCLRVFRGLADRGAGVSLGFGLIVMNTISWLVALEWFTGDRRATLVRLLLLGLATVVCPAWFLLSKRVGGARTLAPPLLWVAATCGLTGLLWLPHGILSASFALLVLAAASMATWWGDEKPLLHTIRQNLAPLLVAHVFFAVGFLFFFNVRTYIPYATYELSLYMAEKWGNFGHLGAIYNSSTLPPKDLWFNGDYTNYYYGGHLLTATLAKATGTPLPVAFNLGLATIFALTLSLGFTLTYSLVHAAARRVRWGRFSWHSGMLWGVFGAVAIACFGNLDPWRQFMTRNVDWGVKYRWEREQRSAQESWKIESGLPADVHLALKAAAAGAERTLRLEALLGEIARQQNETEVQELVLAGTIDAVRPLLERADQPLREKQDTVLAAVLPSQDFPPYRRSASVHAVAVEDALVAHVLSERWDRIVPELEAARAGFAPVNQRLEELRKEMESNLEAVRETPELSAVRAALAFERNRDVWRELLGEVEPAQLLTRFDDAMRSPSGADMSELLTEWATRGGTHSATDSPAGGIWRAVDAARTASAPVVVDRLSKLLGPDPPMHNANPSISELRFTWQNVSFLNFWDPSRAIKSSPSGVKEAGTITEFPAFSALLGDHHPHHIALLWSLTALCACLSLLRKSAFGTKGEWHWLGRVWPELLAMAFLIGNVFAVNIWDSVVLAPLYGLVIAFGLRGVNVSPGWRWVGFAGYSLLLCWLAAFLYNAGIGHDPLFGQPIFWLLAVAVLSVGYPLLRFMMPGTNKLFTLAITVSLAGLMVGVGAILSPFRGVSGAMDSMSRAVRDELVFLALCGVAALWSLPGRQPVARWLYAVGGVYACVGSIALAWTLPFKLFFRSPLQPSQPMFSHVLPPILDERLATAPFGGFWVTFWQASPVNPFPAEIRTELRDFIVHWGIFLFPILLLAVARLFKAFRRVSQPGLGFFLAAIPLAILALARVYLGFWAGAIALALVPLFLWFAWSFARRPEGPAWIFLSVAFFWFWFVEALHFDDDYSGTYERYNTPFKIYYPLWAIMAGGMVVAIREVFARFRLPRSTPSELLRDPALWIVLVILGVAIPIALSSILPRSLVTILFFLFWLAAAGMVVALALGNMNAVSRSSMDSAADRLRRLIAHWPALLAAMLIVFLGGYYMVGATVTRTREFFTWPLTTSDLQLPHRNILLHRNADALSHLAEYPAYREDWKAMRWLAKNTPAGTRIAERSAPDAYARTGRMAVGAGRISILNWKHHQEQWRGRSKAATDDLKFDFFNRLNNPPMNLQSTLASLDSESEGVQLSDDQSRALYFANDRERIRLLRKHFPKATLRELFRYRAAIERQDVTMSAVMEAMMRDANALYTEPAKTAAAELFARYRIEFVVVGAIERGGEGFGPEVEQRLLDWDFEKVYDSGSDLLPGQAAVDEPTRIYRVPSEFRQGAAR